MKLITQIFLVATLLIASHVTLAQQNKNQTGSSSPSHVTIKAINGQYHFYVNNKLFDAKGVGLGLNNMAMLKDAGANSFRTWGSNNAAQVLDSAAKYNLMVAMGLGMGQELHKFDYSDSASVAKQFNAIKKAVDAYKNHPNLLCWVAGNELNLSSSKTPVSPKVYDALKDIVEYIHKTDPNHPVTTTFAGLTKAQVQVALEHCPDLDFLSFQVYGGLGSLPAQAKAAGITKPYAVTEFGPRGHWESPSTTWGREIEETSSVKAAGIMKRIQKGIVEDKSGLCIGSYAFVWGQKQERTPTWYGMFIKSGEANATVDELTKYWTGKYPKNRAPQVDSMKIDGKNAVDNIYLKPGIQIKAKVYAWDPEHDPLTYKWVILKEVTVRSQGGAREAEPTSVPIEIKSDSNGELTFTSPATEGEYRLFSYVFDGKNKVGTANVPFYVK